MGFGSDHLRQWWFLDAVRARCHCFSSQASCFENCGLGRVGHDGVWRSKTGYVWTDMVVGYT